jgi:murein DD-endopeptidase MepM/ murein hydrolase activator NlpD
VLPTTLAVVEEFRAPACTWCEGNRGIEYASTPGSPVGAAAAGDVTYAGRVAGVSYVVVRTARGVLVTHGGLSAIGVRTGERRAAGEAIGEAGETLYIGVRVGGVYVDPRRCSLGGIRLRPRAVLVGR